jgi:predicted nucleic acid-binding Zn finger protein
MNVPFEINDKLNLGYLSTPSYLFRVRMIGVGVVHLLGVEVAHLPGVHLVVVHLLEGYLLVVVHQVEVSLEITDLHL